MERQQWAEAMALTPRPAPNTPYTEAMTHFARAVGAARAGKPAEAAADIARLKAIHDREIEMKDAYWAEQVDIQRRVAEAWVAYRERPEGRRDHAAGRRGRRRGSDRQVGGDAGTARAGARAATGSCCSRPADAKEALVAFEAVTKKEPNRFLALYGAGKAAEATKQPAKAKGYYRQIVKICADAAPDRPELVYARKMAK